MLVVRKSLARSLILYGLAPFFFPFFMMSISSLGDCLRTCLISDILCIHFFMSSSLMDICKLQKNHALKQKVSHVPQRNFIHAIVITSLKILNRNQSHLESNTLEVITKHNPLYYFAALYL